MSLHYWLVVEPYPSEKYEFVNWDDDSQLNGKIKVMFQTTNQIMYHPNHQKIKYGNGDGYSQYLGKKCSSHHQPDYFHLAHYSNSIDFQVPHVPQSPTCAEMHSTKYVCTPGVHVQGQHKYMPGALGIPHILWWSARLNKQPGKPSFTPGSLLIAVKA